MLKVTLLKVSMFLKITQLYGTNNILCKNENSCLNKFNIKVTVIHLNIKNELLNKYSLDYADIYYTSQHLSSKMIAMFYNQIIHL